MTDTALPTLQRGLFRSRVRALAQTPFIASRPADRRAVLALVLAVLWAVLTFGAAFRWFGYGIDYPNYVLYFYRLPPGLDFDSNRMEPGFQLIEKLVKFGFNLEIGAAMFIVVGLSLAIKFTIFHRYTARPLLAAAIYVLFFYPIQEYTQVRTALATAIAFVGVIRWIEGRPIAAMLLFALGVTFHYSVAAVALVTVLTPLARYKSVLLLGAVTLLFIGITPALRETLSILFAAINPLSESYLYSTEASANLFSPWNLASFGAIVFAIFTGQFDRDRFTASMVVITAAGLALVILFRDTVDFALRMRDVLGLAPILLVTRADPEEITLAPAAILLAAAAIAFSLTYYGDVIFGG